MTKSIHIVFVLLLATLGLMGCISQQANERESENRRKVADLNTQLAIAYVRDGENELALKKLERVISADPNYAPAYSTMGLLYNHVGDFDTADSNFRKALRLDSESYSILNNYGPVLCQHGQYEKGQEMFLKANENPLYRSPEIAFNNAGTCALAAGGRRQRRNALPRGVADKPQGCVGAIANVRY